MLCWNQGSMEHFFQHLLFDQDFKLYYTCGDHVLLWKKDE
jgi:hypothetical protein